MRIAILSLAFLTFASCASRNETVVENAVLPMTPGTVMFRSLLKSNPVTDKVVFWGNYGGPGNEGGAPVDAMDVLFLEHDIVYVKKESFRSLRESDRILADSLEQLDPETLSKEGQKYRKRAIFYMRSPIGTVGKLIGTINNPPPPPGLPELRDFAPFPFPEIGEIIGSRVEETEPEH